MFIFHLSEDYFYMQTTKSIFTHVFSQLPFSERCRNVVGPYISDLRVVSVMGMYSNGRHHILSIADNSQFLHN